KLVAIFRSYTHRHIDTHTHTPSQPGNLLSGNRQKTVLSIFLLFSLYLFSPNYSHLSSSLLSFLLSSTLFPPLFSSFPQIHLCLYFSLFRVCVCVCVCV